jgi:ATP-dependent helicase/nuclease subunit B
MWTRDEDWTMHPDGFSSDMSDEAAKKLWHVNELRKKVAAPLFKLSSALKTGGSAREKTVALYAFLEDISLPERTAEKAGKLHAAGKLRLEDEYLQLWDIVVSAMEQFVSVLDGMLMTTEDFVALFNCFSLSIKWAVYRSRLTASAWATWKGCAAAA